jgi:DMSO/TMAO reductase YedYZ molybdopterin-dependent catalytic subunit
METEENNFSEKDFNRKVRRKTIKSFVVFFILIAAAFGIYKWIVLQPKDQKAYAPFRKVLDFNSKVFARDFDDQTLSKEFPKSSATKRVRVNGNLGLKTPIDTSGWRLKVVRYSNLPMPGDTILISMDEIKSLPKTEVIFNFKCIEGWSQISWWGGVKFSDFAAKYNIGTKSNQKPDWKNNEEDILKYCGLITPDKEYYVGVDMPSMIHPQTILCYELNGQPIAENHGAPLRLIIPVKYGIKHLKRIGTIYFSDEQPPDYWAQRGYDYFAGL